MDIPSLLKKLKRAAPVAALLGIYMAASHFLTGSICIIRSSIGLPCPGCGLTRAYISLLSLDIYNAFIWHPLFWTVPLFIGFWFYKIYKKAKYPEREFLFFERFTIILCILFIALFVIRAIFLFPHTEPFTFNFNAIVPRLFRFIVNCFGYIKNMFN